MKKYKLSLILVVLTAICSFGQEHDPEFYLPAEWEPHIGVVVCGIDDSAAFEMMTYISKETKVHCFVEDSTVNRFRKKFIDAGVNIDSIIFHRSPINISYAERDGLMIQKNDKGEKRLIDFQWNLYGWYFEPTFKDYIENSKVKRDEYSKQYRNAFPLPVVKSIMVNEGGAIETNGKGTFIQVESVNMQRNPGMTKEQQESELKKVLNAKKVIWLKEGAADDPFGWGTLIAENYFGIGVQGHVDEFCRFVNDSTIFISYPDSVEAELDPVKKITLERMKVNYEILKNSTDQDGRHFTIIKMPVPDIDYMTFTLDTTNTNEEIKFLSQQILWEQKNFKPGDTVHFVPASSYLNFFITNNSVFQSKYYVADGPETSKAKDDLAKEILKLYFPERKIVQINPIQMNYRGGGLHCWTMQIPK